MKEDFAALLGAAQDAVQGFMAAHLASDGPLAGGSPRLLEAMHYAVMNGGKRLRPFLVIESARLFGVEGEGPVRAAAALEFIHCYSLVHDDLPAMDNDDLRRGKPTTHRAYDEATAILVGDALLTEAFALVADRATAKSGRVRCDLTLALAKAAGAPGMVGGQMLDLAAEGRFEPGALAGGPATPLPQGEADVSRLQGMKTGALLRFACEAGALLAGSGHKKALKALRRFGDGFGLAFQLKDDLLDVEGDSAVVGKATGKDAGLGKATIVGLAGVSEAQRRLQAVSDEACRELDMFGKKARALIAAVEFNRSRAS